VATYAAVALATIVALSELRFRRSTDRGGSIGLVSASAGAWGILWGARAYITATVFDRWWQSSYGMAAGIWHPPQLLKAVSFFAVVIGGWIDVAPRLKSGERHAAFAMIGG